MISCVAVKITLKWLLGLFSDSTQSFPAHFKLPVQKWNTLIKKMFINQHLKAVTFP